MMKNKRKILSIILTFILAVVIMPNVDASSVKINGGSVDIYETGGEGTATFDKSTNTLTLNGYNNDYILFDGFDGEEEINIILKGTNTISSGGYVDETHISALGFDYDSSGAEVTLNVTGEKGSKLNISGYYNGIFVPGGSINVKNANIEGNDVYYTLLYTFSGDTLTVRNSKIKANGIQFPIANDRYDVELYNVEYNAINTVNADIYAGACVIINDSTIQSTGTSALINGHSTVVNRSNLIVPSSKGFVSVTNLEVNDSNIVTDVSEIAATIMGGRLTINNSNVTLVSQAAALLLNGDGMDAFDSKVGLVNSTLKETTYIKDAIDVGVIEIGLIYSYFTQTPVGPFSIDNQEAIMEIAAKQLHYLANNSITFDANGGTGTMYNLNTNGKVTLPDCEFKAPKGKTFKGWSLTKNGSIIKTLNVTGKKTVYAIWSDEVDNPKTSDNMGLYIITLLTSLLTVLGLTKYLKH